MHSSGDRATSGGNLPQNARTRWGSWWIARALVCICTAGWRATPPNRSASTSLHSAAHLLDNYESFHEYVPHCVFSDGQFTAVSHRMQTVVDVQVFPEICKLESS